MWGLYATHRYRGNGHSVRLYEARAHCCSPRSRTHTQRHYTRSQRNDSIKISVIFPVAIVRVSSASPRNAKCIRITETESNSKMRHKIRRKMIDLRSMRASCDPSALVFFLFFFFFPRQFAPMTFIAAMECVTNEHICESPE